MVVEVDPATYTLKVLKYAVAHDCGTVINPQLVDEQVRGGVVQGIGAALYEECVYDAQGQMRNANMADYLVPMTVEMPDIQVAHVVTPTRSSTLGAKGAGPGRPKIAMLVHPKMVLQDLVGPLTVFNIMHSEIHLVWKTLDPVMSEVGIAVTPSTTLRDCPEKLDVLFAPGGLDSVTVTVRKDPSAWKGTIAETLVDLDGLKAPHTVFDGPVREGARLSGSPLCAVRCSGSRLPASFLPCRYALRPYR